LSACSKHCTMKLHDEAECLVSEALSSCESGLHIARSWQAQLKPTTLTANK